MDNMGYLSQIQRMNPPAELPIAKNDLFQDRLYVTFTPKNGNCFLGQKNGHEMCIKKVCQAKFGLSLRLLSMK